MAIVTIVTALCDNLHVVTGVEAATGHPTEQTNPGNSHSILVWPWKMAYDNSRKNKAIAHYESDGTRANSVSSLVMVDCLILAQGGSTLECLTMLENMQCLLLDQPFTTGSRP